MRQYERHGDAGGNGKRIAPEYTVWKNMRRRCTNPTAKNYELYGGRGIVVCDRWLHSYITFLADLGRRPVLKTAKGHSLYTIERVDNDGDYEPSNCVWATMKVQMANKRRLKKHEQAPYWMRHTWGSRHAAVSEEYSCVFPSNMPADWKV